MTDFHNFLLSRVSAIQGRQTQYLADMQEMMSQLEDNPQLANLPDFTARLAQIVTFMAMNQGGTNLLLNLNEAGFELINPEKEDELLEQMEKAIAQRQQPQEQGDKEPEQPPSQTHADRMLAKLREQSNQANEQLRRLGLDDSGEVKLPQ